jgi:AbrB family looped-hinge helix DNA binding protein
METTKLSTKGQVVIPEEIRKDITAGTPFIVTRRDDLIILKKVEGLTEEEKKEMEELNKIWKDIDEGNCETYEIEDFFKKMKEW